MFRKLIIAALAFTLAVAPLASRAADPFEIDVILPLTGYGAFLGKNESETLALVEASVNAAGGVRGRPIKFAIHDDESNPQVAVQLTNAMIAKKDNVILGSALLGSCLAMAPLLKNGPLNYCYSPGIEPAAGSLIFSSFLLTVDLLSVSIRYLRDKGLRKLAVLTPTDATGQDADHAMDAILKQPDNATVSVVDTEHFNVSDISVGAQISRIKASGAQAVIAWTTGTAFGTVLHGATDAGLELPIVTSTGNLIYGQMKAYAAFTQPGVLFPGDPAVAPEQAQDRGVRAAVTAFANLLKTKDIRPDQGHAIPYDATLLVIDALRKHGLDANPETLRAELAGTTGFSGIFGKYDFKATPQRGITRDTVVMVRWDAAKDSWTAVSAAGGKPL